MQHLGRVLHVGSSRNLILRAESLPRIGAKVVDENLKSVGSVFDIFGPVSSPYVAVRTSVGRSHSLVGNTLYTIPSVKRRKEKRKR